MLYIFNIYYIEKDKMALSLHIKNQKRHAQDHDFL